MKYVQKFTCLCGCECEIIETTDDMLNSTFPPDTKVWRIESQLEWVHDAPLKVSCIELRQALFDEKEAILQRSVQNAFNQMSQHLASQDLPTL